MGGYPPGHPLGSESEDGVACCAQIQACPAVGLPLPRFPVAVYLGLPPPLLFKPSPLSPFLRRPNPCRPPHPNLLVLLVQLHAPGPRHCSLRLRHTSLTLLGGGHARHGIHPQGLPGGVYRVNIVGFVVYSAGVEFFTAGVKGSVRMNCALPLLQWAGSFTLSWIDKGGGYRLPVLSSEPWTLNLNLPGGLGGHLEPAPATVHRIGGPLAVPRCGEGRGRPRGSAQGRRAGVTNSTRWVSCINLGS